MKLNKLAFLGDSFTWGEGLELYLDTPFWINQRNKKSQWMDLIHLQNEESINFREKNRFANIVSNHFESDIIIDNSNGGWIGNVTNYLKDILDGSLKPEFIVVQFSCFVRNPIHYHFDSLFKKCKCDRCKIDDATIHCFYHLLETIRIKYLENGTLTNKHDFYLKWLVDEFNFPLKELENNKNAFVFAFKYVNSIIDSYSYLHLNYLIDTYVKTLESIGTKVFYIDSWDPESSKIIHDIPFLKENLIYLKSNDGVLTQSYEQFEKSFLHSRIQQEFPKTGNGHPTLTHHKYIAESIIDTLEKFDKQKKIIKLI
jgi:hypothetical protein